MDLREVQVGLPVAQTGVKKVAALREAASEGHETLGADVVQEVEVVGGVVVRSELLLTDAAEMAEPQLEELLSTEEEGAEREVAPSYCWGIECDEWRL